MVVAEDSDVAVDAKDDVEKIVVLGFVANAAANAKEKSAAKKVAGNVVADVGLKGHARTAND